LLDTPGRPFDSTDLEGAAYVTHSMPLQLVASSGRVSISTPFESNLLLGRLLAVIGLHCDVCKRAL
ncbi:hypothetical protein, partial [Nocardia tenerifensis]